jgi:RNase H-fold protein (predicted Holliday junction resolvase)
MKHNVMKYLLEPCKLAAKFDWSRKAGSILALDVGKDQIGLAVASHPEHAEAPLALDPMPLTLETKTGNRKVLTESVLNALKHTVLAYNVCGFVVSWPVQKEGRCGAPCGKVLHTLDSLVEESTSIVNAQRPFCLWDEHHYIPLDDKWGRLPLYGETTNKTLHRASEEQYVHQCSSSIAVDVWNDFCSKHWPELCNQAVDDDFDEIWDVKPRKSFS